MWYDVRMKKRIMVGTGIAVVIVVAWFAVLKPGVPVISPFVIPMADGEQVLTWDFQGAYTDNPELMAKADADIVRLTGLLGSKQHSDYTLYVSIANQYGLKGDGKNELAYLEKALAVSTTTGLAWHNAGQLLAHLGAYKTARMAFERAATVQPIIQYQRAMVDFLLAHFPEDAVAIKDSQQAVQDNLGEVAQ